MTLSLMQKQVQNVHHVQGTYQLWNKNKNCIMGMSSTHVTNSYAFATIKRNPPSVQLTLYYYIQHCGNDSVYAYTVAELEIRKWKKPFLGSLSSSSSRHRH